MMKYKKIFIFSISLILILGFFQNCSQAGFSNQQLLTELQSQEPLSGSDENSNNNPEEPTPGQPDLPPIITDSSNKNVPLFSQRTKTVSASATGSGDGTSENPWTLEQAMQLAQAGDIVGVKAGLYIGEDPRKGDVSAGRYSPAFRPKNSGTSENPIWFVAEYRASTVSSNYSEIRSGATTMGQGWPAYGNLSPSNNYVRWSGFYTNESEVNAKSSNDSGLAILWNCVGGEIHYAKMVGVKTNFIDNHSGIRLEEATYVKVTNNELTGFKFSSNNSTVNQSAIMTYATKNLVIENNYLYNNGNSIFLKGHGPQYNMIVRYNILKGDDNSIRIMQVEQSPAGERSAIYQNLFLNFETSAIQTSQTAVLSNLPKGLIIANNLFYNQTGGGNLGMVQISTPVSLSSGEAPTSFVNNIFHTSLGSMISSEYFKNIEDILTSNTFNYNSYFGYSKLANSDNGSGSLRNLTAETLRNTYGQELNGLFVDPKLSINQALNSYKLQSNSPLLSQGRDILGIGPNGQNGAINIGPYIKADQSDFFGIIKD